MQKNTWLYLALSTVLLTASCGKDLDDSMDYEAAIVKDTSIKGGSSDTQNKDNPNSFSSEKTIKDLKAGKLHDYISDAEKYHIEKLTLTGELNGMDFRLIRDMAGCNYLGDKTEGKLKVLDFSEAKIVASDDKYLDADHLLDWGGTYRFYIKKDNELPQYLFHGCKFTTIIVSKYATSIGDYAFCYCSELNSLSIFDKVTSIASHVFYYCTSLKSIKIPNTVTSIGLSTFAGCSSLTSIDLSSKITSIKANLFGGCSSLATIKLPESVTIIQNNAFENCTNLTSISLPKSVESIDKYAFSGCKNLNSIILSNKLKSIEKYTFAHCISLKSIEIPDNVVSIGEFCFEYCSSLTSVLLPISLKKIELYAFLDCKNLTLVISPINDPPQIDDYAFKDISSQAILQVPKGSKSKYESISGWKTYFKEIKEVDTSNSGGVPSEGDNPTPNY